MNRLSAFAAFSLIGALMMAAGPAYADLDQVESDLIELQMVTGCDLAASDDVMVFEIRDRSIGADLVLCEPELLAETGLCLAPVLPARAAFAFIPPESALPGASMCPPGRSPTG